MQISTHRSHSARRGSSGMIILSRRAIAAFSWYTRSVDMFDGMGVLSSFSSVETAARTSAQSGLFEEPGVELRRIAFDVVANSAHGEPRSTDTRAASSARRATSSKLWRPPTYRRRAL